MNSWATLVLDVHGNPVLVDNEHLFFASAKLNKSRSPVPGVTRHTTSGNPWFDPVTGRFANGPPGVRVKAGGALMKGLLNTAKQFLNNVAAQIGADAITAVVGEDGHLEITLYKGEAAVVTYTLPTENTAPDKANISAEQHEQPAARDEPLTSVPPGVDPEEWARRLDAVRAAARTFDPMELDEIKEWLTGRTDRELGPNELNEFMKDVRRHRLSDLVDVLDQSIKRRKILGQRTVKVVPPRGWLRRSLAYLEDTEIAELHRRLRARGFSQEDLESHLINRYPDVRRDVLKGMVGEAEPTSIGKTDAKTEDRGRDDRGGRDPQ